MLEIIDSINKELSEAIRLKADIIKTIVDSRQLVANYKFYNKDIYENKIYVRKLDKPFRQTNWETFLIYHITQLFGGYSFFIKESTYFYKIALVGNTLDDIELYKCVINNIQEYLKIVENKEKCLRVSNNKSLSKISKTCCVEFIKKLNSEINYTKSNDQIEYLRKMAIKNKIAYNVINIDNKMQIDKQADLFKKINILNESFMEFERIFI